MKWIFEKIAAFVVAYFNENWKYILAIIAVFILILCFKSTREVLKAFFGIHDSDNVVSGARKLSTLTIGRVLYIAADYWVAGLLGAMVVYMKADGYSYTIIILATWLYDFVAALVFWAVSNISGNDFTFGESYRRAGNKMSTAKIKFVGVILFVITPAWVIFKAIIWDGPEAIVIYFKNELRTVLCTIIALVVLSGIQGLFGAWLYTSLYVLWKVIF